MYDDSGEFQILYLNIRGLIHTLYIFTEYVKFNIDRTSDSESSDIGYIPSMWDEWYSEGVISGSDDSEADTIQCNTSLLDDEIAVLTIEVYPHEVRIILVTR